MHDVAPVAELPWLPTDQRVLYELRRRPRWQVVPVAVLLLVGTPLAMFGLLSWAGLDATGASVLVAVIAGVVASVQSRRQEKRAATADALAALQTTDVLAEADRTVATLLRTGEQIDPDLDGPEDAALITLLDYYELLARMALANSIDRRLLVSLRGGAIGTLWSRLDDYIRVRSVHYGSPLYEGLTALVRYEDLQ